MLRVGIRAGAVGMTAGAATTGCSRGRDADRTGNRETFSGETGTEVTFSGEVAPLSFSRYISIRAAVLLVFDSDLFRSAVSFAWPPEDAFVSDGDSALVEILISGTMR